MKWKPKNDKCGVPGKGFIKADDYSQEDEDALIARAKNRKIDVNMFMINAGFVPNNEVAQLEITEAIDDKPKRTRRTKAEIEAEEKE